MKTCKGCSEQKPYDKFYKHKAMLDGYLNFCVDCIKQKVKANREAKSEYYKEFEKKRASLPHRIAARKKYLETEAGQEARKKALKNYKSKYPMKYAAHVITRNAIRDGKIVQQLVCSECSSTKKVEAHHDDYTKPLDVRWLCEKCHKLWHKSNTPVLE